MTDATALSGMRSTALAADGDYADTLSGTANMHVDQRLDCGRILPHAIHNGSNDVYPALEYVT